MQQDQVVAGGTRRVSQEEKPYVLSNKSVNYVLGIIEGLLFLRFLFKLSGANPAAGIVSFLYALTNVLMAPFLFIFPTLRSGTVRLEWSVLVAMVVYALGVYGIMGLLDIIRTADTNKT